MFGWLARNWKTIATVAVATVAFVAVTALTGGLGAPALVALAAGGFASGAAGYATAQLLDGKPIDPKELVVQGAISTAVTVATAGLGRVAAPYAQRVLAPIVRRAVPEVVAQAVPQALRVAAADAAIGGTVGGALQVGSNAVRGRPLSENVGQAVATGAATGALIRPLTTAVGRPIEAAAQQARASVTPNGKGIAPALRDLDAIGRTDGGANEPTTRTVATRPIDPVTQTTMTKNGMTPDTIVYRVMDPKYVDATTRTVAGNPKSMAIVQDPYNLVESNLVKVFANEGLELPPGIDRMVPRQVNARDLGPSLNVAMKSPDGYAEPGMVKIGIRLGDVLAAGGKIYPDVGSNLPGIKPFIVTFEGSVPFTYVEGPAPVPAPAR